MVSLRGIGKRTFLKLALATFSGACWSDTALFELPLESLLKIQIETPSKYSQSLFEAPGVISVISKDDIEMYGALNLRDVVGRLPGLLLLTDGDIQNDNFGVRGDTVNLTNHVLLLINGRPFRSVPGASDAIRRLLNTFPIDLVEQVEYIRGPGSALYSTGAYTAILNVITLEEADYDNRLTIGGGTHDAGFASYTHTYFDTENPGSDFVINLSGWRDEGWKAEFTDVTLNPIAIDIADDHRTITAIGHHNGFQATLYAGNRDSDTFGQRPGFEPAILEDEHVFSSFGYAYELSDQTTLEGNVSWLHTNVNAGQFKDDEYLVELDLTRRFSDQLKMLLGLNTLTTDFKSDLPILGDYDIDTTQLYVQFDYQLTEGTHLILGGQANRTEQQQVDYVPRLGLVHQLSGEWGMKFLYNEAYRNPNTVETGTFIPTVITGNRQLKPETARTVDLEFFHHTRTYYTSLTLFQTKQQDLISPTFNADLGFLEYSNVSERVFRGAELVFSRKLLEQGISLDGSISYQENKDTTADDIDDITTLPSTIAKLGFGYQDDTFSMGLWNTYVSDFQTNPVYDASKLFVNPVAKSYNYLTANFRWLAKDLSVAGKNQKLYLNVYVQNLLDKTIRQNTLQSSTPLNAFPSETDRAIYLSASLEL